MPLIDLNGLGHFKDKENAMVANDYSASSTYAVGDYVFYNGTLFRCKTAITTAEAWTAGHWEAAVLTDAVSELNTKTGDLTDLETTDKTNLVSAINEAFSSGGSPIIYETTTEADIATFADGADGLRIKSLTANIEPVQDDTYGDPYPAGGGVNLAPNNSFNGKAFTAMTFNPALQAGDYVISYVATRTGSATENGSIRVIYEDESYLDNYMVPDGVRHSPTINATKPISSIYIYSISGSWAESQNYTITVTDFQLEVGTTATSYAPYSNICPISGWTGMNLTRCGANLMGGEHFADSIVSAVNNSSYSAKDTTTKTVTLKASNNIGVNLFPSMRFEENTQYTFILQGSKTNTNPGLNMRVYYTDGTSDNISFDGTITADTVYTKAFVSASSKTISYVRGIYISATTTLYYDNCGIFKGSLTADDFVAYNGSTISVNWTTEAGTVYGGTFNPITGKLVATHAKIVLDGTQSITATNWSSTATSVGWLYSASVIDVKKPSSSAEVLSIKSDTLATTNYGDLYNGTNDNAIASVDSNLFSIGVRMSDTTLTTQTLINAYLAENPITVVYPLATPVEYTLTASQIETLYATNNIFCDTGSIESVTYPADTKLYIDNAIATAIASI